MKNLCVHGHITLQVVCSEFQPNDDEEGEEEEEGGGGEGGEGRDDTTVAEETPSASDLPFIHIRCSHNA